MRFTAQIEIGVAGYRYSVESFAAADWQSLKNIITHRMDQFAGELMAAQERYGDLRGYAPCFANGYPTCCFEPELGEDFTVTLLDLTMDGQELGYRTRGHGELRRLMGRG